jgi:Sec-independent protein secretion pathway component TatC
VLSQLLMAGPLYGLFNLSIVIVWMIRTRAQEAARGAGKRDRRRPDADVARMSVEKNRSKI